jgi:hypothetical protein
MIILQNYTIYVLHYLSLLIKLDYFIWKNCGTFLNEWIRSQSILQFFEKKMNVTIGCYYYHYFRLQAFLNRKKSIGIYLKACNII